METGVRDKFRYFLILIAVGMLLGSCNRESGHKELARERFNAGMVTVQAALGEGYTEVAGTVTGAVSVPISTKLFSTITYMGYEVGDRVRKGDVLARIDDADIRAMRSEAAAYRAEAAAALGEVDTMVRQGEAGLAQAESMLAQAEAARIDAELDLRRAEYLAAEDTIPLQNLDKAKLGMTVADQNVEQARQAITQAEAMIAQAESKRPQIEAKKQQALAKDAQAAAKQGYATLYAPFDGLITKRMFEPGQIAASGMPIYVIEDDSGFRVELDIPEHLLPHLSQGAEVPVIIDMANREQREVTGTVDVIGAAADRGTHTVPVELTLPDSGEFYSGMFVRVRVPTGSQYRLMIPVSAVVTEGEQLFVWRVSARGVAEFAPVELGPLEDGMFPVVHGLGDGDRIVSDPPAGLYAGAQISGMAGSGSEDH